MSPETEELLRRAERAIWESGQVCRVLGEALESLAQARSRGGEAVAELEDRLSIHKRFQPPAQPDLEPIGRRRFSK
jgi:hypothetical protein